MPTLSRRIIVGMIIVVVITASVAVGLYILPPKGTSSSGGSIISSSGLKLSVSINATRLKAGQAMEVSVSLHNNLDVANNLTISDNLPFQGVLLPLWPPCFYVAHPNYYTTPAQAIILKGNFTTATISSMANVSLWSGIICHEGVEAHNVIFEPD